MGFPYYAVEAFSAEHFVGRMGFRTIAVYAADRDGTQEYGYLLLNTRPEKEGYWICPGYLPTSKTILIDLKLIIC